MLADARELEAARAQDLLIRLDGKEVAPMLSNVRWP